MPPSYLGWICSHTVAFVVDVPQFLLQVQLDPVVKSDDGPSSSRLSDKHVLKPWRIWPGKKNTVRPLYSGKYSNYPSFFFFLTEPASHWCHQNWDVARDHQWSYTGVLFQSPPTYWILFWRKVQTKSCTAALWIVSRLPGRAASPPGIYGLSANKEELWWGLGPYWKCIRETGPPWLCLNKDSKRYFIQIWKVSHVFVFFFSHPSTLFAPL